MSIIEITANDDQVVAQLRELVRRIEKPRRAMEEIAGVMEDATALAFALQQDPTTGDAWAPLRESTMLRNPKRRGGMILQASGLLSGSITSDAGDGFAEIGTNRVYALTHQFGAERGEFGQTRRGGPIPWGDIAARPFLGIGSDDEQDILDIATRFLRNAVTPCTDLRIETIRHSGGNIPVLVAPWIRVLQKCGSSSVISLNAHNANLSGGEMLPQ